MEFFSSDSTLSGGGGPYRVKFWDIKQIRMWASLYQKQVYMRKSAQSLTPVSKSPTTTQTAWIMPKKKIIWLFQFIFHPN